MKIYQKIKHLPWIHKKIQVKIKNKIIEVSKIIFRKALQINMMIIS
jgi:hypothetical protein